MTSNLEMRLLRLEARVQAIGQQIDSILARLANLEQQRYAGAAGFGGGGGGGGTYFGCILSADCPAGTPGGPASGQTVWKVTNGARSNVNTNADVYNDTPNDFASGWQAVLAPNDDGSYTIIGKPC